MPTLELKEIEKDLCTKIAELLEVSVEEIKPTLLVSTLGLGSLHAVALKIYIEDRYGVKLSEEVIADDLTLTQLAAKVNEGLSLQN